MAVQFQDTWLMVIAVPSTGKYFVLATTPTRLYQFQGYVSSSSERPLLQQVFCSDLVKITSLDNIFPIHVIEFDISLTRCFLTTSMFLRGSSSSPAAWRHPLSPSTGHLLPGRSWCREPRLVLPWYFTTTLFIEQDLWLIVLATFTSLFLAMGLHGKLSCLINLVGSNDHPNNNKYFWFVYYFKSKFDFLNIWIQEWKYFVN